jgi:hypothetical protein
MMLSGVLRVIRPETGEEPERFFDLLRFAVEDFPFGKSSPPSGSDEPVEPRRYGKTKKAVWPSSEAVIAYADDGIPRLRLYCMTCTQSWRNF